jgi:Mor family transcriptional regulator
MTMFDIVTDAIGLDNSLDLMEKCGGMVFYIPKNQLHYRKLRCRIQHLQSVGYSEKDIVLELSNEFERSKTTIQKAVSKVKKGLFDEY